MPRMVLRHQNVALAQSWEPAARQALLEQAVKFEPAYYYYYRMYATSILPKWGGEEGKVETFLQRAADHIGGSAGDILYFQVSAYLVCCQYDQQLKLSWPRIQKGFAAVEKQNGAAPENWNLLARLAASFNDPVVANKMLTRIGDQWSEDVLADLFVLRVDQAMGQTDGAPDGQAECPGRIRGSKPAYARRTTLQNRGRRKDSYLDSSVRKSIGRQRLG